MSKPNNYMVNELREAWYKIYKGLSEREFGPLNGEEYSRGGCHTPDERHYILITDGMIIYSTTYHWDQPVKGSVTTAWYPEDFTFEELDLLMASGQQL